MPTIAFPLQALATEVEAALLVDAEAVEQTAVAAHYFGAVHREQLGAAPRYVWVPTRTREQKPIASRAVDEVKPLMSSTEYVEIDCWGSTFAQAWAMRNNLLRALKDAVAMVRIENGEWVRPTAALNQSGELYRLEVSLSVPTIDQYTNLDDMTYPAESTVVPTVISGVFQIASDLEVADTDEAATTTA